MSMSASVAFALALLAGLHVAKGDTSNTENCPTLPTGASNAAPANPGYQYGSYNASLVPYGVLPLATPAGPEGEADLATQTTEFFTDRGANIAQANTDTANMIAACNALGGDPKCVSKLSDFLKLYAVLPNTTKPLLADYWDSDAAFARMRITIAPRFLRKAPTDYNVEDWDIVGLDKIIANTGLTLPELLEEGRVFVQDTSQFTPFFEPAPYSHIEFPIALFFIDGANATAGRLMPLAIKFTYYNNNTYSPFDDHYDWLLAKMFFNTLDTFLQATIHILDNHFMIDNYCVAAKHNFADTHPALSLISPACTDNSAINNPLLVNAFTPGLYGVFDQYATATGGSGAYLLTHLWESYDFEGRFVDADVEARGLENMPNYVYYHDNTLVFNALLDYATGVLGAYYKSAADIKGDAQLQAYLTDLYSSNKTMVPGFPDPKTITTVDQLARVFALHMWTSGPQHHSMNSDKEINFDWVYPIAPGKLFAPPPTKKGQLNETLLLDEYLIPPGFNYTLPANPTDTGASMIPHSGLGFFFDSFRFKQLFGLQNLAPNAAILIGNSYPAGLPGNCPTGVQAAVNKFSSDLTAIENTITAREANVASDVFPSKLLLPSRLPANPQA